MTAGYVDLDVRYLDALTNRGVALDSIRGRVRNAVGTLIEEIVPLPYIDDDGALYSMKEYSVLDTTKFSGLFLTVDWIAIKGGIVLPTFSKQYDYQPVTDNPADKTIVYWAPPDTPYDIAYYEIYRKRTISGVVIKVLAGRSFGPSFVDRQAFSNEFEARSWSYEMYAFYHYPGFIQPDGSDYIALGVPITPSITSRTGLSVCLVEGRVRDVTGAPYVWKTDRTESFVSFFMDWNDRHSYVGDRGLYITPSAVQIPLATDGGFSVALVQDVVATLIIEWSGLKARFVVPRKEQAFINDLNMEIAKTW